MPQARCGGKRTPYSSSGVASAITPAWSRGFVPMYQTWRGFLGWGRFSLSLQGALGDQQSLLNPPARGCHAAGTPLAEKQRPQRGREAFQIHFLHLHTPRNGLNSRLCAQRFPEGACVWGGGAYNVLGGSFFGSITRGTLTLSTRLLPRRSKQGTRCPQGQGTGCLAKSFMGHVTPPGCSGTPCLLHIGPVKTSPVPACR